MILCQYILYGNERRETYTSSSACSDVVGKAGLVVRVAHEDGNLDGGESGARERSTCSATHGVVHDLSNFLLILFKNELW